MIAASDCPRCPSDSAEWRPMTGLSPEPPHREIVVGDIYTCKVCNVIYYYTKEAGVYIPPQDYP